MFQVHSWEVSRSRHFFTIHTNQHDMSHIKIVYAGIQTRRCDVSQARSQVVQVIEELHSISNLVYHNSIIWYSS